MTLSSLENHSSSLSCKCYEMPLKHLSENLSMLVVTVPSVLMEADPGLPCKEANAVDKNMEKVEVMHSSKFQQCHP